jgi:CPA2 family monovalent cation:H+ antiporter-2
LAGEHPRSALHAGIALAQVGEFSFVILQAGLMAGLVAGETYQIFLAVAVSTLGLTPLLVTVAPAVSRRVAEAMGSKVDPGESTGRAPGLRDHLVIVGGGLGGRHVAKAARSCGIPYVILEMNPERVRELRKSAEPARYGDAVYEPALHGVQVHEARVLVLTIQDPAATRRIIALVRKIHPGIQLIVRTRYVAEIRSLLALGANQVVTEEFETSIEIFIRVLAAYMIPHEDIQAVAADIRAGGYQMLRGPGARTDFGAPGTLPGTEVRSYRVAEAGEAAGRTLSELEVRIS